MRSISKLLAFLLLGSTLAGCTAQLGAPEMSVQYARIASKTPLPAEAEMPGNAMLGGVRGALRDKGMASKADNHQRNVETVARNFTGRFLYELDDLSGKTTRVVSEKGFFERADCVAVEQGASLNLRLVEDSYCIGERENQQRLKMAELRATQCSLAKKQLLIAQSERELSSAQEQVVNLCQFSAPK